MASQVFSGNSNFTYTNNTGQNARVVISYMESKANPSGISGRITILDYTLSLSWAGVSLSWGSVRAAFGGNKTVIGKNIAFLGGPGNFVDFSSSRDSISPSGAPVFPVEVLLAPGQTFSATCGIYNVVVIPENG